MSFILNNIHDNPTHIINFVCILLKQFLYKHRCLGKTPTKEKFVVELTVHHNIEFANVKRDNVLKKHVKKWSQ